MSAQRPYIGITTSFEDERQMIFHHYIRAIEIAGGLPLIVPMLQTREAAQQFAGLLDGLVITGGPAISDGLVGTLPSDLPQVDAVRDTSDKLIYELMADSPMLGICYGMQFINARAGGTIYADVMAQRPDTPAHSTGRGGGQHLTTFAQGSRLHTLLGAALTTNSHHIQALASVGDGLKVSAVSPDGVIEGIESADGRLVGVQFHPERMLDAALPLFEDLVRRCQASGK